MPPDSMDTPGDSRHLRHERFSALTVIQSQTHLVQRHLRRMNRRVDGDRQRLEAGRTVILISAHTLGVTIDRLPAISQHWDTG